MALVHEKIYQHHSLAAINMAEYASNLSTSLLQTYEVQPGIITLDLTSASDILFSLESAVSMGLWLNEVITNSIKYAFPDHSKGRIWIKIARENDQVVVLAGDNGKGFPEGFEPATAGSLGLNLIHSLAAQMGASLSINFSKGVEYRLCIPADRVFNP